MSSPPTGTVTFLFADIEGSTKLWQSHPQAMQRALARHDEILRGSVESHQGYVVKMRGDGIHAAFAAAEDALAAAVTAERALHAELWGDTGPLRVRMALHTGTAEERDGDYFGTPVNRAARLLSTGHGGQILLSLATQELVQDHLSEDIHLRDLGEHRLKDLARRERIFQVVAPGLPSDFPPLHTVDVTPNNLPVQLTSFIGRAEEIQRLEHALAQSRLVTLTGAGGCGKTRLALQAAAALMDHFADGVWFVDLAPLSNSQMVPRAVAAAVGIREEHGHPLTETICKSLCQKSILVVLDNCEHVLDECGSLVSELLVTCENVKVLATSRELLGISGEAPFRVPSLSLPESDALAPAEDWRKYDAARLFVERALTARPDLHVDNSTPILEICRRLDGIPLAIELAAARARMMTPEQIATRLDDRFKLLTGGSRVALPRHKTLRALIDWSYDQLSQVERRLLGKLSIFKGGAFLEAVEAVCAEESPGTAPVGSDPVLDVLTRLLDKSLVQAEENAGQMRYRMLETVAEYAREKLAASGGLAPTRNRHRDYFLHWVEEGESQLLGAQQIGWLDRLELEYGNVSAALGWTLLDQDAPTCLRFGGGLWRYWVVRGHWTEGREWLTRILTLPGAQVAGRARAKALNGAGFLALYQGDYAFARSFLEESLSMSRAEGDRREMAEAIYGLGTIAQSQGDYAQARSLFQEGLGTFTELADQWGIASAHLSLGNLARSQGDLAQAQSLFESSLRGFQELGDQRRIAQLLGNLGIVAYTQGNYASASMLYEQALAVRRQLHDKLGIAIQLNNLGYVALHQTYYARARELFESSLTLFDSLKSKRSIADVLCGLAGLAASQAQPERAARLLGASEGLLDSLGASIEPANQAEYDTAVQRARLDLDEAPFELARAEGKNMTLEQAIAYALGG